MKRIALLAAVLVLVLAPTTALAQDGEEFCAIPEGCDLDGDGVAETPSGAPVASGPTDEQYGGEGEFCAIPEGCGSGPSATASATAPAATAAPEADDGADKTSASASASSGAPGTAAEDSARSPAGAAPSEADASAGASVATSGAPGTATVAGLSVLPDTGGASLPALACGLLLVAGGLLSHRVLRR